MATQWIVREGMFGGALQGIHYPSLVAVLWAYRVKDRRTVFDDVRLMEVAALPLLNEAEA